MNEHYNYKVHLAKGTDVLINGEVGYLLEDIWSTITFAEPTHENVVKYYAMDNLCKRVAKLVLGNVRFFKRVEIDMADIEVIEA